MSVFLCEVEKTFKSESWVNTYGIRTTGGGDPDEVGLAEADVDDVLPNGADDLSDAATEVGNAGFQGESSIIAAIVAFERQIHATCGDQLLITNVKLTDHIFETEAFVNFSLSLNCLRNLGAVSTVAGGSNCALVERSPAGFGARSGHIWYRGALYESEITFDGFRLLGLSDPATYRAMIIDAADDSHLSDWFWGTTHMPGHKLVIPTYQPKGSGGVGAPHPGDLIGYHGWAGIGTVVARERQVQKGRKRPTP